MSNFKPAEDTMVLGAGPVGLAVIANLRMAGAGIIIATEIVERRAEMARKLGADYVFNPHREPDLKEKVFELTKGKGIDRLFQCSANHEAFKTGTDFIRRGGQIMVVDCIEEEVPIIPTLYCYMEWEMKGALCYYWDEFPMAIELLRKGVLPVKEMITKKIRLSDIAKEGFEVLVDPARNTEIKILVEPD
jgi:threonine dehydrogenase-like Zn-dependent dehydrogenase